MYVGWNIIKNGQYTAGSRKTFARQDKICITKTSSGITALKLYGLEILTERKISEVFIGPGERVIIGVFKILN